jgi:hypothetical protein
MLEWVVELRGRGVLDPLVVLPKEGPLTGSLQAIGIPYAVVPFEPWMSERNYMGRPHHRIMQYLADHGTWSDMPLDQVVADFRIHYPGIVERAAARAAGRAEPDSQADDRF